MASNSFSLASLLGGLFKTQKARFTFVGFLFGASFPVGAVIIDSFIHDLPLSLPVIVQHNPLHYLIATAPLVLGFLSGLAGIRDDRIQSQQEEIESINTSLSRRNQEMQDILYHIDQGILTINSDFSINQEYSSFLEQIFQRADLQGVNFLNLIYPLGPASNKKDLKEFLELLFGNKNATDSVIRDLNPIKELEFALTEEKGEVQVKYLNFDFVRIMEGEQIRKVMVIIKDLTEKTLREKEHAKERREFEQELHRISAIVKIPLEELEKFIEEYEALGKKIELHFSTSPRGKEEKEHKREELNNLLSRLHALKGEARLYELSECAQKIHLVEEKSRMQQRQGQDDHSDSMNQAMEVMLALSEYKMAIKAIKDTRDKLQEKLKPGSSTESHRAVRELLPHLEELSATIEEQIQALKGLGHDQGGDSPAPADTGWLGELEPLLHRSQNKLEKQTGENKLFQLQINQYLSSGQLQKVNFFKPVVIQLLQNSLAHGIEPVAERRQTGKAEQGIIRLTLQRRNQSTVLTVQDDGRGVPPELIVRKLQEKGQPVPQGPIDPQEAVKWILQSGFSAATHNTEIAGHGLGMDMVRRLVKEKNGKLSVRNRPHEGLAISITLPDAEN